MGSMEIVRVLRLPHLSWAVTRLELFPMILLATCTGANQQYGWLATSSLSICHVKSW